jgi:hypothetical protein
VNQDINNFLTIIEKIIGMIGSIIYLIFSGVIVKQVTMMSKNINDKYNGLLIAVSYFHLVAAIVLVLMVVMIL